METFGNPGKESFSKNHGDRIELTRDSDNTYRAWKDNQVIVQGKELSDFMHRLTWYMNSEWL